MTLPSDPTRKTETNTEITKSGIAKTDVAKFLDDLKARQQTSPSSGRGRLIFALDATASRQPTWDRACHLQNEMFEATAGLGGLATQLVFYRGYNECKNSRWVYSAAELHRVMSSVTCEAGHTQIKRCLQHVISATKTAKVAAMVFVGDAMEEEIDELAHLASELGTLATPAFMLQEGSLPAVADAFKLIAKRSGGAHLAFDLGSIDRLKELLGAIAIFATGNRVALENYGRKKGGAVLQLTSQLKR